jgi:hypothetical protein
MIKAGLAWHFKKYSSDETISTIWKLKQEIIKKDYGLIQDPLRLGKSEDYTEKEFLRRIVLVLNNNKNAIKL